MHLHKANNVKMSNLPNMRLVDNSVILSAMSFDQIQCLSGLTYN